MATATAPRVASVSVAFGSHHKLVTQVRTAATAARASQTTPSVMILDCHISLAAVVVARAAGLEARKRGRGIVDRSPLEGLFAGHLLFGLCRVVVEL